MEIITEGIIDNIIDHTNKKNNEENNIPLDNVDSTTYPAPNSVFSRSDVKNIFLFKTYLNYIYDMNTTLNTFDSIKNNKIQFNLVSFNFKAFFESIVSNLKIAAKIRRVDINLTSDSVDEDIFAVYDTYRGIFFNLIHFIINNYYTDKSLGSMQNMNRMLDKYDKPLNISVQFKRYRFFNHHANFYKTNVTFSKPNEEYMKFNFLQIHEILSNFDFNKDFTKEQFYNLAKLFDIGIIMVYYLIKVVYNSDIVLTPLSDSIIFSFIIGGISPLLNERNLPPRVNLNLPKLSENNIETERICTDEILKKIYNLNTNTNKLNAIKISGYKELVFPTTYIDVTETDTCKNIY